MVALLGEAGLISDPDGLPPTAKGGARQCCRCATTCSGSLSAPVEESLQAAYGGTGLPCRLPIGGLFVRAHEQALQVVTGILACLAAPEKRIELGTEGGKTALDISELVRSMTMLCGCRCSDIERVCTSVAVVAVEWLVDWITSAPDTAQRPLWGYSGQRGGSQCRRIQIAWSL